MKTTASIDTSQFSADIAALIRRTSGDKLMPAVKAGGFVVEGAAKVNIREKLYRHPTGNLMNSIGVKAGDIGTHSANVTIGTNVIYAAIHEFGGTIVAKNGPFLHFVIDGRHVQTRSAQMPARPYLRPAINDNKKKIVNAVGYQLAKMI